MLPLQEWFYVYVYVWVTVPLTLSLLGHDKRHIARYSQRGKVYEVRFLSSVLHQRDKVPLSRDLSYQQRASAARLNYAARRTRLTAHREALQYEGS